MRIQIIKKGSSSKKQSCACDWLIDAPPLQKK
jgi:hypothetical protein